MKPEVQFFYDHGSYSYDPKTETRKQGRVRCAELLAEAESVYLEAHKRADVGCEWRHDDIAAPEGGFDDTCECACIWHRDEKGEVHYLASLGAIWDADENYRRVIRAELALEAIESLRKL